MSDESIQSVTPDAPAPDKPGGFKAFFATTLGKIVIIGGAIVVLLTIVTVVAVIVLGAIGFSLFQTAVEEIPGSIVTTQTAGSQASTSVVAAVPMIENSEVFTPRDPFQPVVVPSSATAVEGSAASTDDENTLTLLEIIEENGVRKAVLRLGATMYTLAAGEQLGSTPWQVVTVGTNSATMLYGDSQIVLTVGQGVQTK
ncbi:MAG: hypothetical protein Q7W16_05065 [Coriobacteriia bacterium]|nr:hypothetical protein [Coriobacteriia bacterium]